MKRTPATNPDMTTILARYRAHAIANRDAIEAGRIFGFDVHTGDTFDARTGRRIATPAPR